jgi:beclin 1-associated autophagy-related key regulator
MTAVVSDCEEPTDDVYGDDASTSSNTSSLAPTDFRLSQSYDCALHAGAVSVALERCLLCWGSRRSFYCRQCVRSGDFVHSRAAYQPFQPCQQHFADAESYAEKLRRWKLLKKEREKIVERFHTALAQMSRITQKQTEIRLRQQRIQMMKIALTELSETVTAADQQRLGDLRAATLAVEKKTKQYEHERGKIIAVLTKMSEDIERHALYHRHTIDELTSLRRHHIKDLITYIFPISELPAKSESTGPCSISSDDAPQSTVSLLADARRMAYVKGRWVYTDIGYDQLYQIVSPTLPGNGDYSMAVIDNKDDIGSRTEYTPFQKITAALSLTAQLVSLVAYYLDVILPRHLKFSEFCASDLTEQSFNRAVLRLNHNILRLCFTQSGVDIAAIEPRNTIINLLAVLNSPQLGSSDGCRLINDEETATLMRSIESSLLGLSTASDDLGGISRENDTESSASDIDECDDLIGGGAVAGASGATGGEEYRPSSGGGWEHVPITLPDIESSMSARTGTALPSYLSESHSTMTSIVSSLWRVWGRSSDK